ncbi:hypothetical protein Btru_071443 [Bulinus truncatus]|nr:hypothetical protein Btru_071443 [Bulinus truncatus]
MTCIYKGLIYVVDSMERGFYCDRWMVEPGKYYVTGSALVNAGLYVPSRSYVFYIPKGLTPGDPVGVIRTLDSWTVPCGAESELRLQADQRSNLTTSWEGTDIVLKVMSSADSWTVKETLSLSLAIECDWRGRQFEGYYKPLTSSTLTFHPLDIGAGQPRKKKAPPARTQADLLKRSCPAKRRR